MRARGVFWGAFATTCALLFANVASAQISAPRCGDASPLSANGALCLCLSMSFFAKPVPTFAGHALAVALQKEALERTDHSELESICRDALRADPSNPALMFQLARTLTLANKHREAVKYYLDAADHRHAGAMD